MKKPWRTVRVFISSTFRDMHAERDHLVRVVFPELQERLEKHRIHLVDIDLRWGVTAEQVDNDKVLDLCLDQIDRCRPFFVGILGQRYGWVPKKFPDPAIKKYGWVQGMTGKSITELEVLHGVLRNPGMRGHAMFLFRKSDFLAEVPEMIRNRVYVDENSEKLTAVKEQIRDYCQQYGSPLREYPCRWGPNKPNPEDGTTGRITHLEQFGEWAKEDLWDAISKEYPQILEEAPPPTVAGTEDWLDEEQDYHERFMESRLRVYIGREAIQRELTAFADGDETVPCLVTGPSGAGKSAALAKFATDYTENNPDVLVISHFIGASPASTNLRQMLRRFCLALQREFDFTETREREGQPPETMPAEVKQTINELIPQFRNFVGRVPEDHRSILVIDALNQLDETDNAQAMYWLPRECPPHIKVVVSCVSDPDRSEQALQIFEHCPHHHVEIKGLTGNERLEIVREVPLLSAKTLDPKQVGLLLSNPATENPLFLLVALEELRGFGSFEHLNSRIQAFPCKGDTVTALFTQIIERLESDFGEELTHSVLTLLASTRRGLSEQELSELVRSEDHRGNLFPVLRQLRPYLQHRGELLDFYHRNLYRSVREKYLRTDEYQQAAHLHLAKYFAGQDYFIESLEEQRARIKRLPPTPRPVNIRKVDELPWQLLEVAKLKGKDDPKSKHWDDVADLLTDWQFLEAKAEAQP